MNKTILKIAKYLAILFLCVSCARPYPEKIHPEYPGVAIQAKNLVDEYLWLSAQNNIHFHNQVTVGFKEINYGAVVGICSIGEHWREIDLDISYWNGSTINGRVAVLFHELTHCYCGRGHDYGDQLDYSESESLRNLQASRGEHGFMQDGCPMSIMVPTVVDDTCMVTHWSEYLKEMFDRCEPF